MVISRQLKGEAQTNSQTDKVDVCAREREWTREREAAEGVRTVSGKDATIAMHLLEPSESETLENATETKDFQTKYRLDSTHNMTIYSCVYFYACVRVCVCAKLGRHTRLWYVIRGTWSGSYGVCVNHNQLRGEGCTNSLQYKPQPFFC